jgi:hypothetical protein
MSDTEALDATFAMLGSLAPTALQLLAWQSMEVAKRLEAERDAMRAVVKAAELFDQFGNTVEIKLALAAYRKATRHD